MKIANTLSLFLGVVLTIIAFQWIINPQVAAESLNMIYLDGEGRNTQIRDFTAFFLSQAIFCFLSLSTKRYHWICCAGIIFLVAAIFNIFASIYHSAPITITSLVAEIIFLLIAFVSAFFYKLNEKS